MGRACRPAAPPAPQSTPFTPCCSPRSSFPPLPGRSSQPHLRAASGCKNAQLGGGGVGGWGAWTGWGSLWKGPDGALGAPLVSASSVHGPGARTTVTRTEVSRGGLRGEREGTRRGGRERRGGERKRGGGRATRQSCECACADLARCPGEGESERRPDLDLWLAVLERGSRPCWLVLGLERLFP